MKFKIYTLAALAMAAFAACDDETYNDWAQPQANEPQKPLDIEAIVAGVEAINLNVADSAMVKVLTPTLTGMEGADVKYVLNLVNGDKNARLEVNTDGYVEKDALQEAIASLFGRKPVANEVKATVVALIDDNGSVYRQVLAESLKITVTPIAPVLEISYYLVGNFTDWKIEKDSLLLSHSGKDVYEDPMFSLTMDAPVDAEGKPMSLQFKVAPISAKSGSWDNVWGASNGMLKQGDGSGNLEFEAVEGAKKYSITLNMLSGEYTIKAISYPEQIYVASDATDWKPGKAWTILNPVNSEEIDGKYSGYARLGGEWGWHITLDTGWKEQLGGGTLTPATKKDGDTDVYSYVEVTGLQSGDANMEVGSDPYVAHITVDLAENTIKVIPVKTVSVIGVPDWNTDTDLTYDAETHIYSTTMELTTGGWKFRVNHDWDLNLGGSMDALVQDAGNLEVAEAGTYKIELDLAAGKVSVTKQ